jgi:hypothetical protein
MFAYCPWKALVPIACLLLPLIWGSGGASGDDFRIDNKVFISSQKQPDSRGCTIFYGEAVYDFLEEPAEVIVLDKPGGRFVLLDLTRQVRAELTKDEVAAFSARLKQWAAKISDPQIKFFADPAFEEQFNPVANELTLASPWMTYKVRLVAGNRAVAEQYREFSDWYVRLNTVLNPGSRPPFARLLVNEAIAKRFATPEDVTLTLAPRKGPTAKRTTIRSQHELTGQLARDDLDRVAKARAAMQTFAQIGFEQYRKGAKR